MYSDSRYIDFSGKSMYQESRTCIVNIIKKSSVVPDICIFESSRYVSEISDTYIFLIQSFRTSRYMYEIPHTYISDHFTIRIRTLCYFIPVYTSENPKNIYTAIVSTVSMVSGVKETKKTKWWQQREHLEARFSTLNPSPCCQAQRNLHSENLNLLEKITLTFFIRSVILQCERQNSREDKIHWAVGFSTWRSEQFKLSVPRCVQHTKKWHSRVHWNRVEGQTHQDLTSWKKLSLDYMTFSAFGKKLLRKLVCLRKLSIMRRWWSVYTMAVNVRDLKQRQRPQQRERHKFAYLRAFFTFVYFFAVVRKTATWNNQIGGFMKNVSTWG